MKTLFRRLQCFWSGHLKSLTSRVVVEDSVILLRQATGDLGVEIGTVPCARCFKKNVVVMRKGAFGLVNDLKNWWIASRKDLKGFHELKKWSPQFR